jgi:hypothetical protein
MGGERESRRCGRCKKSLPVTAFARYGNGYQSYCRQCQKEYDAAWYQANKERRKAKVKVDREVHREWMDSLKEGIPCTDCGRTYPTYVMEWDHLPEAIKRLVLSNARRSAFSKKRILEELEKCELVCANCHRERTFGPKRKKAA